MTTAVDLWWAWTCGGLCHSITKKHEKHCWPGPGGQPDQGILGSWKAGNLWLLPEGPVLTADDA